MYSIDDVAKTDKDIADLIEAELARQNSHIELIASENWVSKAVMAAMGSPLTNKYAEGYPGKRFYGGCSCVDEVEALAIERAKELFGCEYANVQPHSGAQANMAVFFAMLQPGDTVMEDYEKNQNAQCTQASACVCPDCFTASTGVCGQCDGCNNRYTERKYSGYIRTDGCQKCLWHDQQYAQKFIRCMVLGCKQLHEDIL